MFCNILVKLKWVRNNSHANQVTKKLSGSQIKSSHVNCTKNKPRSSQKCFFQAEILQHVVLSSTKTASSPSALHFHFVAMTAAQTAFLRKNRIMRTGGKWTHSGDVSVYSAQLNTHNSAHWRAFHFLYCLSTKTFQKKKSRNANLLSSLFQNIKKWCPTCLPHFPKSDCPKGTVDKVPLAKRVVEGSILSKFQPTSFLCAMRQSILKVHTYALPASNSSRNRIHQPNTLTV